MALNLRQTGYRLPLGEWFNDIINVVNGLTGGTGAASSSTLAVSGASTLNATTVTTLGASGASTLAATSVTDFTQNGLVVTTPQILAAAGATQGNAGVITKSTVIVTVTASTQGVKLPTAATGKRFQVFCPGTVGVKVYPNTNDKLSTAATNAAVLLVADKANTYVAKDATTWVVQKGA
jgi:hypothetical protein